MMRTTSCHEEVCIYWRSAAARYSRETGSHATMITKRELGFSLRCLLGLGKGANRISRDAMPCYSTVKLN